MATSRRPLPEDLYGNILLRLSVMSLLRFKCVCKNWYALIKNPNFIKQHLNNCSNNKALQLLIYDFDTPDDGSPPVTVISDHNSVPLWDNLNYLERFTGMTNLVGSVDGLFLVERVSEDYDAISLLALWNPATREVRVLPKPEIPFSTSYDFFGFGLDPSTNDYKVVNFDNQYAMVYSCSKDSWRIFTHNFFKIKEVFGSILEFATFSFGSAYLNGAYYWAIRDGSDCNFLSFDFSNEVFEEIDGPSDDDDSFKMPILFDDSLALFNCRPYVVHDLWVMIQPGVWNKLFTFQCFSYFKSWYSSTVIVATRSCRLVSYNVKTQKTTCLGFHYPRLRNYVGVYTYKESLVIIKRDN